MAERLNNTIETQINDGNTIVSQIVDNNQPLQTVIQDVPQIQTVLQNGINVSSQINAPFVEVTSVNGKTGDVITEPVVGVFEPNHYYLKNTMIGYNNNLYYAKETFTSGSSFNANDWYSVEGSQITVDSALSTTSENPVQNKVITTKINEIDRYYRSLVPVGTAITAEGTDLNTITYLKVGKYYCSLDRTVQTFVNCPTTNAFMMEVFSPLSTTIDNEATSRWVYRIRILTTYFGKMYIQRVNSGSTAGNFTYGAWEQFAYTDNIGNGTLTIQRNGTNVQTFTANQSGNATANISVPTKTSDITNDSGFITGIPTASASTLGGIKVGDGLDITNAGVVSTKLQFTDETSAEDVNWELFINKLYPVGSIYLSTSLDTVAKVQEAFGGTWEAWGSGRVPVGVDATQTEFNTVNKTGGEKTHTLTIAEMPSHSHQVHAGWGAGSLGNNFLRVDSNNPKNQWDDTFPTGGDQAHNNLQPYITCYMYRRIS